MKKEGHVAAPAGHVAAPVDRVLGSADHTKETLNELMTKKNVFREMCHFLITRPGRLYNSNRRPVQHDSLTYYRYFLITW